MIKIFKIVKQETEELIMFHDTMKVYCNEKNELTIDREIIQVDDAAKILDDILNFLNNEESLLTINALAS